MFETTHLIGSIQTHLHADGYLRRVEDSADSPRRWGPYDPTNLWCSVNVCPAIADQEKFACARRSFLALYCADC